MTHTACMEFFDIYKAELRVDQKKYLGITFLKLLCSQSVRTNFSKVLSFPQLDCEQIKLLGLLTGLLFSILTIQETFPKKKANHNSKPKICSPYPYAFYKCNDNNTINLNAFLNNLPTTIASP